MNRGIQVLQYTLTRQEALFIHMRRSGCTFAFLGKALGVTAVAAKKICMGETTSTDRHAQLKALGFPEELLPIAFDYLPGARKFGMAASIAPTEATSLDSSSAAQA